MSDQTETKLGVMLESIQDLFKLIPTKGPVNQSMLMMLGPVLEQGLVLIARQVNKLPADDLHQAEQLFGKALFTLSNGLADDLVTVDDYAAELQEQLHQLQKQVKLASQVKAVASV